MKSIECSASRSLGSLVLAVDGSPPALQKDLGSLRQAAVAILAARATGRFGPTAAKEGLRHLMRAGEEDAAVMAAVGRLSLLARQHLAEQLEHMGEKREKGA